MSILKMVLYDEKTLKTTIQKLIKISEIFKDNICGGVFFIVKPCFCVHSNFTYDSEAGNLMKLYFETSNPGLYSSLLGSPEPNSEVLNIRPLLHVQCGYYRTVYT